MLTNLQTVRGAENKTLKHKTNKSVFYIHNTELTESFGVEVRPSNTRHDKYNHVCIQ